MNCTDKKCSETGRPCGGLIVKTKSEKMGRTFYCKKLIDGKVPVYLFKDEKQEEIKEPAMLCDPRTLTQSGFID